MLVSQGVNSLRGLPSHGNGDLDRLAIQVLPGLRSLAGPLAPPTMVHLAVHPLLAAALTVGRGAPRRKDRGDGRRMRTRDDGVGVVRGRGGGGGMLGGEDVAFASVRGDGHGVRRGGDSIDQG